MYIFTNLESQKREKERNKGKETVAEENIPDPNAKFTSLARVYCDLNTKQTMPIWSSGFIRTVLAPHWLEELDDDRRRMSEEAAKRKSFHSTKAHGNGGGSNARDGNADSSSREGNGGSVAAGDDRLLIIWLR